MKPVVITFGDAAGIGPEIVAKTFADTAFMERHPAFVAGDAGILKEAVSRWAPSLQVQQIASPEEHIFAAGKMQVVSLSDLPAGLRHGEVSAQSGLAAFHAIRRSIEWANEQRVSAICTAPIHKEALSAAGVPYPGHTEMLADLSGTSDYGMMLANPHLRTLLVTVHCSILDAVRKLSVERELQVIRLADRSLKGMGIAQPRIAVAGLNPHAGEGGLFGSEDIDIIAPAVARAREEGIDAVGPLPGDTVFMQARKGRFDIVVAQYHDQGLIPVKLLGVEDGVNVTVGLPFVRTSPDHGTAFDIAGKGIADPSSLKTALATAHQLARSSAAMAT
jgi:4-hydroxythreonine-4-phosphate dehydrogenase